MTTALDPARARQLIADAREDDARMTRAPWAASNRPAVFKTVPFEANVSRWYNITSENVTLDDAVGITRTRNNLAALADQLEAALAEIERLRAPIGSTGLLERANKMRDRLREFGVDVDGPGYSLDPPFGRLPERVTVDTFKPRNRQR